VNEVKELNPETTLFVVVSKKHLLTQETQANATTIKKVVLHMRQEDIATHFAITEKIKEFKFRRIMVPPCGLVGMFFRVR
jgi:glucose-6-phosphate isomerase